tara:strand:+ start:4166 stop:4501 length:336 start_codon:yes stop_codon:yes gene_type:complete
MKPKFIDSRKNSLFQNTNVLVTEGTGLIGRSVVDMFFERGTNVRIASLNDPLRVHPRAEFLKVNLMKFECCLDACQGMDYVFHLIGIKRSPAMTAKNMQVSLSLPCSLIST